jgi:2-phospho-L-lactate guanylyltransferase
LAGVLSAGQRETLTRQMVTGVIRSALSSESIEAVVVVSPDPDALALAAGTDHRVVPVRQPSEIPGLLAGLDIGRTTAEEIGASGLLVIFGDLPLLGGIDVRNMVRRAVPVVIAPDRHGCGTNALLLRLSALPAGERFEFQFGEHSYRKHVAEAHRLGLDVATSIAPGTAFDLDTPADLQELLNDPRWNRAGAETVPPDDLLLDQAS